MYCLARLDGKAATDHGTGHLVLCLCTLSRALTVTSFRLLVLCNDTGAESGIHNMTGQQLFRDWIWMDQDKCARPQ